MDATAEWKVAFPLMVNVLFQKLFTEPMFLMIQTATQFFYFGLAETPLKERYGNHTRKFKHEKYENSTELAKYICQLKRSNINFTVK